MVPFFLGAMYHILPGTEWLSVIGSLATVSVGIGGLLIAGDLARVLLGPTAPGVPEVGPEPSRA